MPGYWRRSERPDRVRCIPLLSQPNRELSSSVSLYATTASIFRSWQARRTLTAISPRLAMRTFRSGGINEISERYVPLRHEQSAIDRKDVTSDIRSIGRNQKGNRPSHIFWLSKTTERDVFQGQILQFFRNDFR